jgi:hypothetical protein
VVAQLLWVLISQVVSVDVRSYYTIGAKWLNNKKFVAVNVDTRYGQK